MENVYTFYVHTRCRKNLPDMKMNILHNIIYTYIFVPLIFSNGEIQFLFLIIYFFIHTYLGGGGVCNTV